MLEKPPVNPAAGRAYVYSDFLSSKHNRLGLSHNLYSRNCSDKHKTPAPHQDSLTPWSDDRIKATLDEYRRQQLAEDIFEFILYALFGAMLMLAYFTE